MTAPSWVRGGRGQRGAGPAPGWRRRGAGGWPRCQGRGGSSRSRPGCRRARCRRSASRRARRPGRRRGRGRWSRRRSAASAPARPARSQSRTPSSSLARAPVLIPSARIARSRSDRSPANSSFHRSSGTARGARRGLPARLPRATKSLRNRRTGSTGLPSGPITSHGTTPSASTTRPHSGNRIEGMSRSTYPPDTTTRPPRKESREFYRPAHRQRINQPRRVARKSDQQTGDGGRG